MPDKRGRNPTVPTPHPLSNLKARAQAAFRFTYSPPLYTADDNESSARDCNVVCLCNVKTEPTWAPCDCPWCESMGALGLAQPSALCWGRDQ